VFEDKKKIRKKNLLRFDLKEKKIEFGSGAENRSLRQKERKNRN